jgi:hypothetical protein
MLKKGNHPESVSHTARCIKSTSKLPWNLNARVHKPDQQFAFDEENDLRRPAQELQKSDKCYTARDPRKVGRPTSPSFLIAPVQVRFGIVKGDNSMQSLLVSRA